MTQNSRYVVAVLAPDRVGLLRDVTAAVLERGGNIAGIRQTVVDGFFNLVFTAEHPPETTAEDVRRALAAHIEGEAAIIVRAAQRPPPTPHPGAARYVAVTRGPDRPGTIHAISAFFVEHGVNIEDWQVAIADDAVLYTAQVTLPAATAFQPLQAAFRARMAERGLNATICHENIFRATTEIGPIKRLLRDDGRAH
jgi:predicted amino acid-binding ACT domain protein